MNTSSSDPISSGVSFQNSLYIGINIQNILYGMELLLYFKTMHIVLSKRRARTKSDIFYAIFSSIMVFLTTLRVVTQAWIGQEMWLLNPDFPGGPYAYWQEHNSNRYMDLATAGSILLQLMTDALMMHRCRIVWNSYRAIIVPIILWLVTLALGFLVAWLSSAPLGDFFTGSASATPLGAAYATISVFLNTTLTGMICYRMVRHGQKVQEHLGREHASLYFNITTMIIESALPFTISGIALLVSFGMGSQTSIAFISVYIPMMCISPQMLILRVIARRAWDNEPSEPRTCNSTIRFAIEDTAGAQQTDGTGVRVHLQTLSNMHPPDGHHRV